MKIIPKLPHLLLSIALGTTVAGSSETAKAQDLSQDRTLYLVAYSHLDTQWRWDYSKTINDYIPRTMRDNFAMFEKYPHYIFNFTGSNRYQMMKDYYPADFEKVKHYVAAGRWFPAGSAVEEGDTVVVSPEALLRQMLYGNLFFAREFGKTSSDFMLPDSFGFPAVLPTLVAHAGLKGFSTQKLTWLSSAPVGGPNSPERTPEGIPFNVGVWEGLDGSGVVAALNPEPYTSVVAQDITKSPSPDLLAAARGRAKNAILDWPTRVQRDGEVSGVFADYHYYGAGDIGGAPLEASIRTSEAIITKRAATLPNLEWMTERYPTLPEPASVRTSEQLGEGPVKVVAGTSDQMFSDLTPNQIKGLPRYQGDLLLTRHSTGVLTSQAYMKRWNRENEILAGAAEATAVDAEWLGGRDYPRARLERAWNLVLAGHFHDSMAGTAIPSAYQYSWNDEVLALNQFAGVLTDSIGVIASRLDTRAQGIPVVIYNPLNVTRADPVELSVSFPNGRPAAVRAIGPDGKPAPAQLLANGKVLLMARAPALGYSVYDIQPADRAPVSSLRVSSRTLENSRYLVTLNEDGDIASIFDKKLDRQLLSAPLRLAFQSESPKQTPAWDFDWDDQKLPPRGYVKGPAQIRIVEDGPVRVALEITRETEGSRFVQTVRLAEGDAGDRVEIANNVDWHSHGAALKATFVLQASNPQATYSWDIGTVKRGNNTERSYEVPTHQWLDLTDRNGRFGVTVLTGAKYGSDKPADNTVRLTLLYSPGIDPKTDAKYYPDQASQDWGRHNFVFGLASHAGDYRAAQTDWQGMRLDVPLFGFETPSHAGPLGRSFALVRIDNPRVRVMALKEAEQSDDIVLRLAELDGRPISNFRVGFAIAVTAAKEITGQEKSIGPAKMKAGELIADLAPYSIRSFAVTLQKSRQEESVSRPASRPVALAYDRAVATEVGKTAAPGFDAEGRSIAAEMLPRTIAYDGIEFKLALASAGTANAVVARGQTILLPTRNAKRVYLLAASADGDRVGGFRVGSVRTEITVQAWRGFIGQWDNRRWSGTFRQGPPDYDFARDKPGYVPEFVGLDRGFVKQQPVAWFASHQHDRDGKNIPYAYSYLYGYALDIPHGATTLTLPDDKNILLLAVTVSDEAGEVTPASLLYDDLQEPAGGHN